MVVSLAVSGSVRYLIPSTMLVYNNGTVHYLVDRPELEISSYKGKQSFQFICPLCVLQKTQ
jgi:hypothetical protein